MNIMAIDPGVKNGVAVFARNVYVTMIVNDKSELYPFFKIGVDHVVIERFASSVISKFGLHTVQIVGGVQMLAGYLDIPVTTVQPQTRLAFLDFAKTIARRQGIAADVGDNHAHQADALAHLLRKQYELDQVRVQKGKLLLFTGTKWEEIA